MTQRLTSYSTDGPTCPHCGFMFTPDDATYYRDSYKEDTCQECGRKFTVDVERTTSWRCVAIVDGEVMPGEKS